MRPWPGAPPERSDRQCVRARPRGPARLPGSSVGPARRQGRGRAACTLEHRRGHRAPRARRRSRRSEEHTSELQSRVDLVCRLLLEKKKKQKKDNANEIDILTERGRIANEEAS